MRAATRSRLASRQAAAACGSGRGSCCAGWPRPCSPPSCWLALRAARPAELHPRLHRPEPHHAQRLAGLRERRQRLLVQLLRQSRGRAGTRAARARAGRPGVRTVAPPAARRHDRAVSHRVLRLHRHVEGARRPLPAAAGAAAPAARGAPVRLGLPRAPGAAHGAGARPCGARRGRHGPAAHGLHRLQPAALAARRPRPRQDVGREPHPGRQQDRQRHVRAAAGQTRRCALLHGAGMHPVAYSAHALKLPVPGELDDRHSSPGSATIVAGT